MPIYPTRPRRGPYGYIIGILTSEQPGDFLPGEIQNAESFEFPVLYQAIDGLHGQLTGDAPTARVIAAAQDLEARGVRALIGADATLLRFQQDVVKAVRIPVMLSPLLQLPLIAHVIPAGRTLGVLAVDSEAASRNIAAMNLNPSRRNIAVASVDDAESVDSEGLRAGMLAAAEKLKTEHPDLGCLVLEGGRMCRHARALHDATGLPIFDALSMTQYIKSGANQNAYAGYY